MKMKEIGIKFLKAKKFLTNDIFNIDSETLGKKERVVVDIYKVITLAINDFIKDKCTLWAASLTYLMTLSFIPTVVVGLFIVKVFDLYKNIFPIVFNWMVINAPSYEPLVRQILTIADGVNLTSFGTIGIISTIVSMALLLNNIQKCLISIWNVKITTSLPRIIADYIALLVLIPILIGGTFTLITYSSIAIDSLPTLIRILLSWVVPVFSMWILILFFYVLIPQTKVTWVNAAISSLIVALAIIILLSVYFKLNVNVKNYKQIFDNNKYGIEYTIKEITHNPKVRQVQEGDSITLERISYIVKETKTNGIISSAPTYEKEVTSTNTLIFTNFSPVVMEQIAKYNFKLNDKVMITSEGDSLMNINPVEFSSVGILAQIPVLLVLMYIFWLIILFGAELTYSLQYVRVYGIDKTSIKLSFSDREILALSFMHIAAKRFINKENPPTVEYLAKVLKTAPSMIIYLAELFEKNRYIITVTKGASITYSLAVPPESVTVLDILYTVREYGDTRSGIGIYDDYYKSMFGNYKDILNKNANMTLLDSVKKDII